MCKSEVQKILESDIISDDYIFGCLFISVYVTGPWKRSGRIFSRLLVFLWVGQWSGGRSRGCFCNI